MAADDVDIGATVQLGVVSIATGNILPSYLELEFPQRTKEVRGNNPRPSNNHFPPSCLVLDKGSKGLRHRTVRVSYLAIHKINNEDSTQVTGLFQIED